MIYFLVLFSSTKRIVLTLFVRSLSLFSKSSFGLGFINSEKNSPNNPEITRHNGYMNMLSTYVNVDNPTNKTDIYINFIDVILHGITKKSRGEL